MKLLATNLLLALFWIALTARPTPLNFAFGFALGYLGLHAFVGERDPRRSYFRRVPRTARFALVYLAEIVVGAVVVAREVLTRRMRARPALLAIPLEAPTDFEITVIGNFISFTPGSLTVDVSRDKKTLYVHVFFVRDEEVTRRELRAKYEQPVLEVLR